MKKCKKKGWWWSGSDVMEQIAANVTLSQSLITVIVTALVGPLSALIGAGAVLYANKKSHDTEKLKMLRQDRKRAYINFIHHTQHLIWDREPTIMGHVATIGTSKSELDYYKSSIEIRLIGSPEVINLLSKYDPLNKKSRKEMLDNLIPLMANELQGEDVYKIVNQLKKSTS